MASFFLLVSISLALLSNCLADLIGDICSKSGNPSLCNQALRSDPRSHGADARGLGQIAIDEAQTFTQASTNVAKSVANGSNQGKINTCIENFNDAVDNLNECKNLIKAHDRPSISTLQTKGSAALSDLDTCSDEFGASEPPQLKEAAGKAFEFIQVLLIIANSL